MDLLAILTKPLTLIVAGAALVVALAGGIGWYGHHRYEAGKDDERQAALVAQQALTEAMQQEKDRAEANYRGAVLARQAAESQIIDLRGQVAAAGDRITGLDGLLQQYRNRAKNPPAGGRSDGAGPDWIGIFGQCVARVESLSGRLADVGRDAARWADQVNGLQGYIRGINAAGKGNTP